ncbi:hypothetical protein PENTCL1PPCAC_11873, partial [Pristionchus entomophagus]
KGAMFGTKEKISRGNASKSSDFNPRTRVDRHMFNNLRHMTLVIACIGIGSAFIYHPFNAFVETHIKKVRKRGRTKILQGSRELSAAQTERIEDYLKDEHLLYNWHHPQQLLTPIECYPSMLNIDSATVAAFLDRAVRCGQSKDYLVM